MVLDVKIGLKALFLRRQGGATENEAPLTEEAEESGEGERHEAEVTERTSVSSLKGKRSGVTVQTASPRRHVFKHSARSAST